MTITLNDREINEIQDICNDLKTWSPKNQITQNMCSGIPSWIAANECLTEKQAIWLVRNIEWWSNLGKKITRPACLQGIGVPEAKPLTLKIEEDMATSIMEARDQYSLDKALMACVEQLARIAAILEQRLK